MSLARYPYHSGRTEDLQAMISEIHLRCPGSPISLVGFSMGGNIALKYLGENGGLNCRSSGVVRAVAICPPIDLSTTVDFLRTGLARLYDSYFTKVCIQNVRGRVENRPDTIIPEGWFSHLPRTMREFDESFTAPVCGFASANDYYARSSTNQFLPMITVPTLMVGAEDDPVIPFGPYTGIAYSPSVQLIAPKNGGHCGFVTTNGPHWIDNLIIDWSMSG